MFVFLHMGIKCYGLCLCDEVSALKFLCRNEPGNVEFMFDGQTARIMEGGGH
jgi:hypothetical protein